MRIYLTGFMGSGKTYWGKVWADARQCPFYDLDDMITASEHKSVLDIFEQDGEDYFRMKETIALHNTLAYDNCIISCGGGTPCFNNNMAWMNEHGLTVYLSATPQLLLENIMTEKDKRPLLKKVNEAELLFFIQQTLENRQPFYNLSTLTLHADQLTAASLETILSATS